MSDQQQQPYPEQPNRLILSDQDVSCDCKISLGVPRNMGRPVPGLTSKSRPPSQLPEMPIAWFQICFRCGQEGPRKVPCPPQRSFFLFLSLPTASVMAARYHSRLEIYWLAFHTGPVCFHKGQCPQSLLVVEFLGRDATTQGTLLSTHLTVCPRHASAFDMTPSPRCCSSKIRIDSACYFEACSSDSWSAGQSSS